MQDIVEFLRSVEWMCHNNMRGLMENDRPYEAANEIERLRKDKAELLKALTNLYEACRWEKVAPEIDAAKDAIAKATGGE